MRAVLVTGGTSGIGAAACSALADSGFRVFAASRTKPEQSLGRNIDWIEMDVCNDASVEAGVAGVVETAGGLDALVSCAGFGIFGSIEEVSIEASNRQFETNVNGTLRLLRSALPHMRNAGAGRIALVGSLAGRAPIPFQAHYSASKAAVESIAGALYNEMRPHGIEVSLIEPGDINTPFNDVMDWNEGEGSAYSERIRNCEQVIRESLPKAPGPEVVARAIVEALTAARPKFRYSVGPDSVILPLGKRLLPDWACLRLIADHFKV